jgi:histone H1/5
MAETTVSNASTTPSKSKSKASSAKKPKLAATHPPVAEMVVAAINNLKDRSGSSSQAIKKYIASNYKVEVERLAPFIKKYLKSAVTNGTLQQTKGKGASGSFKIAANSKPKTASSAAKKPKAVKAKKSASNPSTGTPKARKPKVIAKTKSVKKVKTPKPKKVKVEKKAKAPKPTKSPKKVKTSKPKTVKKVTTSKRVPKNA